MSFTAVNPVTITGNIFQEKMGSPRITMDSSGITMIHEYRCLAAPVKAAGQILPTHWPDPSAFPDMGWDRGAQHWLSSKDAPIYKGLRLVSWEWARGDQQDTWGTFQMTFAYPYGLDFDVYGEKWEYNFASESVDIKSVNEAKDQITWEIGMDQWANKQKGIGVDGEEIHGTTAYRPAVSLQVTKIFEEHPGELYLKNIARLTNHVNKEKFDIWEKYEALFLGATISQNSDGRWQMGYSFLCGSVPTNEDNVTLADGVSVNIRDVRTPWNYVWYEHVQVPVTEWVYVPAISPDEVAPPPEPEPEPDPEPAP